MGARPVLATEATLVLNPDAAADSRIGHAYQLLDQPGLTRALEETYRIVRVVAGDKQVPLLDAGATLNPRPEYFTDHVHLSAEGSEAMAQLIADFLATLLATPGGPSP
jgi:lysophospholipase L1-like esterase